MNKTINNTMTKADIEFISYSLSNPLYHGNLTATEQLIFLFNRLSKHPLKTHEDYINMYDDNFYTYRTWEELVKSEADQSNGFTKEECIEQLNKTIWKLPCGWYVQYV